MSFGTQNPNLGQARLAHHSDDTLIGIREPLAEHEGPTVRTYLAVGDIDGAMKKGGEHGVFAIVIHGDVEHGLGQPVPDQLR